ncbi:hypothetical protein POM88_043640 [Heracleum sosnowskyi]|uniref:ABC transporter domain-containing protein n=1 Tax=Heracleum sosnowskyi TaxID=360622 RepID=A0AAD8H3Q8_9APIA|nr:hypothetical protein POM88_043633 [Heracleum sosnowskyi]KAK1359162.1 hypothetical protein POM88_043636 [Heracleum sosnowskyi]KAK1359166.1 hypothetical protein POM88_043640 [Heracleum sosnowskyi]
MFTTSVKMMGLGKVLRRNRNIKIYTANSHVFSRNDHKVASTHSFRRAHCYLQSSPCSSIPENPRGKGCEQLLEEPKPIRKGDVINLHDLLFTKNRDYLVRYNGDKVKAEQLAGKVIVLKFANIRRILDIDYLILKDTYTYLLPDNVFEVVWVAYEAKKYTLPVSKRRPPCLHHGSCRGGSSLLFFDEDGKIVRKILEQSFHRIDFPSGLKRKAYLGLNAFYGCALKVMILNNFSLKVSGEQTVAVDGVSGSGKSSIISLLERFINDPTAGLISLDGRDLKLFNLRWPRSHISLLHQEPVIFSTSVIENIIYRRNTTEAELKEVAKYQMLITS